MGIFRILSLGHGEHFLLLEVMLWAMYLNVKLVKREFMKSRLPDFMVFMNLKELPWFWLGFDNPLFAFFDGYVCFQPF